MNGDPILVWNGLVTRVRRSVGDQQDGKLTPTTSAGGDRGIDIADLSAVDPDRDEELSVEELQRRVAAFDSRR